SLKCRICGHIAKDNRAVLEEFQCVNCGHTENADLNASINILAEGHSEIACGVETSSFHNEAGTPNTKADGGISWRILLL
ncbi:MAG: zinc ribbon domain-containing protein, partial [Candidatus Hydromicrobium sp.]|nr:zinc ribbon domain-containing protein [Candidatus Hydromicrobium sp.]